MSERESIVVALGGIARRLKLQRSLNELVSAACWVLIGAIVYQILRALLPHSGTPLKLLLLLWVLAVAAWTLLRLREKLRLEQAATAADQNADLKDELKSAYWFLGREQRSPLIEALLQRASATAKRLNAQQVVPNVVPRRATLLAGLALLTGALAWWSPQLAHSLTRLKATVAAAAQAQQDNANQTETSASEAARTAQQKAAQQQAEAAAKLKAAQEQARAQALAEAQRAAALAQGKAEAGEAWTQLERALGGIQHKDKAAADAIAEAIKARDAKRAAQLLEELERKQQLAQADPAVQPHLDIPFKSEGEGIIPKLQDLFQQQDDPFADPQAMAEEEEKALKDAENAERKLNETTKGEEQRMLRHEEVYAASIGNDSVIEASRYGDRSYDQQEGTGSQETGQKQMKGGVMHRRASMTRGDPSQQGGSRVGEAEGGGKADPMIGKKTERLQAQLKRVELEAVKNDQESEGDSDKLFAATQQQQAKLAYATVERRARYVTEEATSGERVPLVYRNVVKDYFVTLRQNEK